MEGGHFTQINRIEYRDTPLPKGREILLRKISMDKKSALGVGTLLRGRLEKDFNIGQPFRFDNGTNTSAVAKIYKESDKYYAQTQTSIYEMKFFEGLNIKNNYGEVSLPEDAIESTLGEKLLDSNFTDPKGEHYKFYINQTKLRNILLEVNGANLFRAVAARFMVIAKVRNIHLPFYMSSAGTGGKIPGQWYPFFGYNGNWLVKGNINKKTGEMYYHPEISKVQDILNENLIFPANFISPRGKFGEAKPNKATVKTNTGDIDLPISVEPVKQYVDLNDYFNYQNIMFTDYENKDEEFLKRITGYNPERVVHGDGSCYPWIDSVIKNIKK